MHTLNHYLHLANVYLLNHPQVALWVTFIVAFVESLPLLGTVIPGSVTMTIIGILVGRGIMPFIPIFLYSAIGALLGDILSFWLGKRYNQHIRNIWPFRKYTRLLTQGENFFYKHGGKSILIGRFVSVTRSLVPLVGGLMKMRWRHFMVAASLSATLWAFVYLLPGILIGAVSLQLSPAQTTVFILVSLAVVILLWLLFWLLQRFFSYIIDYSNRCIDTCWNYLQRHHSTQWFIRLITKKNRPEDHHQLSLCLLVLLCLLLFVWIMLSVILHLGIYHVNQPLFHLAQNLRTNTVDTVQFYVTLLGEKTVLLPSSLIMLIVLVIQRQWRWAIHLALLVIATGVSIELIKWLVHSPRPSGFMVARGGYSFPSGHSVLSITILGYYAYYLSRGLSVTVRRINYTTVSVMVLLILLSRLYLGAHWFCDVFGGLLLGFSLLLGILVSLRRHATTSGHAVRTPPIYRLITIVISILIPWGVISVASSLSQQQLQYQPKPINCQLAIADWKQGKSVCLKSIQRNIFGQPLRLLNIQWAASLSRISQQLNQNGWQTISLTRRINSHVHALLKQPNEQLPWFTSHYRHQKPVLFMSYRDKQQRVWILRLWATYGHFSDNKQTLWLGNITVVNQEHYANGVSYLNTSLLKQFIRKLSPSFHTIKTTVKRAGKRLLILRIYA